MHNIWPLSSLHNKHCLDALYPSPSLFVSVQINMKVQNVFITARPTDPEETRGPCSVSLSSQEQFWRICLLQWHMALIRLKLIRTSGPRNEHNKGKPPKTASWLLQVLWVQQQLGGRAEQVHVTEVDKGRGGSKRGCPAGVGGQVRSL